MSGGQRQAIAVLRAVAFAQPARDPRRADRGARACASRRKVLELVARLPERGVAVLLISHNLEHVAQVADRAVVLRQGRDGRRGGADRRKPRGAGVDDRRRRASAAAASRARRDSACEARGWTAAALRRAGARASRRAATTTTRPAASGDEDEPVRVAVIMASLGNDFYVAQKAGIEAEAAKQAGADVTSRPAARRASTDEVVGLIENAIAKDVDAIAVNGSDTKPLLPALKRVIDAGIPLVLFDAPADELDEPTRGLHRHGQPRRRRGRRRVAKRAAARRRQARRDPVRRRSSGDDRAPRRLQGGARRRGRSRSSRPPTRSATPRRAARRWRT